MSRATKAAAKRAAMTFRKTDDGYNLALLAQDRAKEAIKRVADVRIRVEEMFANFVDVLECHEGEVGADDAFDYVSLVMSIKRLKGDVASVAYYLDDYVKYYDAADGAPTQQ